MAAAGEVLLDDGADVLRALRTATGRQHEQVEAALDLLHADLSRERLGGGLAGLCGFWGGGGGSGKGLVAVLGVRCGFWRAGEAGLDDWAARELADAAALDWPRRRRAAL